MQTTPISAGAYVSAGLAFMSLAAGFFWAAYRPEYVGIGIVFSILTLLSFVGAFRSYAAAHGVTPGGVSYFQFMKTREQLRSELKRATDDLAAAKEEITNLRADLAQTKPRTLDHVKLMNAAGQLLTAAGLELRKHAIYIYPVPTVHDSSVVAHRLKEALEYIDLHPQIRNSGPTKHELPFMEFGTWVFGDSTRLVERALGEWLRSIGLPSQVVDRRNEPHHPRYDGFEIWIAVGNSMELDDAKLIHDVVTSYVRGEA